MTKEEAIERLRNESCKSRVYCELYPDACMKEECEIYMAIEALKEKKTKVICDYDDCKWIESGVCQKDSIDLGKPVYVTMGCPNGEEDDDD